MSKYSFSLTSPFRALLPTLAVVPVIAIYCMSYGQQAEMPQTPRGDISIDIAPIVPPQSIFTQPQEPAFVPAPVALLPEVQPSIAFDIHAELSRVGYDANPHLINSVSACFDAAQASPFYSYIKRHKPYASPATLAALAGACSAKDSAVRARKMSKVSETPGGGHHARLELIGKVAATMAGEDARALSILEKAMSLMNGKLLAAGKSLDTAAFALMDAALENQYEQEGIYGTPWRKHKAPRRQIASVEFFPQQGPLHLTFSETQVSDIAKICQNEADNFTGGVGECAKIIINRVASGWFGPLDQIVRSNEFNANKDRGGFEHLLAVTPDSLKQVHAVITKADFGTSTFYENTRTAGIYIGTAVAFEGTAGDRSSAFFHDKLTGMKFSQGRVVIYDISRPYSVTVERRLQEATRPTPLHAGNLKRSMRPPG